MTDKQIIIDGVDVSVCEKQGETIAGITCGNGERIRLANEIITKHKLCKDNPNCVYKQLKRKERECEELKEKLIRISGEYKDTLSIVEDMAIFLGLERIDHFNIYQCYYKLKEILNEYRQELDQLKQTLTEIKEIAESYTTCKMDWYFGFKNILQKK